MKKMMEMEGMDMKGKMKVKMAQMKMERVTMKGQMKMKMVQMKVEGVKMKAVAMISARGDL